MLLIFLRSIRSVSLIDVIETSSSGVAEGIVVVD